MRSENRNASLAQLLKNYRAAPAMTTEAIHSFLSSLNCPRSLTVWMLFDSNEHLQLVDLVTDPLHYRDPFGFRDAYAATTFLSKSNFLSLDLKRDVEAYKKFDEYELLCGETNNRFRNLAVDPLFQRVNASLLHMMTQKISSILGEFVPEEWIDGSNWGPGVTTRLKGSEVSSFNKFQSETGITRDLYSLVGSWFPAAYPLWSAYLTEKSEHWASFEVGNTIVTVPKNSKTDRVIAVEPGINLWFQKGIGRMIRRRLLRRGIDLTDQTANQRLAQRASHDDSLATVDFSSASDSISTELVREVIPPDWFRFLDACRSKIGIRSTGALRWNKFSSMGNGFTFELESLIFFAAADSVCRYLGVAPEVSVFGDDVLLPTQCYDLFSSFSRFLGFRVNQRKSFAGSPFRESCGAHYFDGVDVKPIFLKERIQNVQAVYKLANSVRNFAHRRNSHSGCDARFHRCWRDLFRRVPKALRLGTSRQLGDSGFSVNFDEACPPIARDGIEGYRPLALLTLGKSRDSEDPAMLLCRLKDPSIQECGNSYTLRGRTETRFQRVLVHQWYNFGPWY